MTLTCGDVMTHAVKTLQEDATLLEALQLLHAEDIRHLPVLQGDRLVGVLTDRDLKRATPSALSPDQHAAWKQVVQTTPLAKVMSREPTTATPRTLVRDALRLFVEERIGCLPVLQGDRLVGILTARDLFRAMLHLLEAQ